MAFFPDFASAMEIPRLLGKQLLQGKHSVLEGLLTMSDYNLSDDNTTVIDFYYHACFVWRFSWFYFRVLPSMILANAAGAPVSLAYHGRPRLRGVVTITSSLLESSMCMPASPTRLSSGTSFFGRFAIDGVCNSNRISLSLTF
jgi:hypothetical protein